VKRTIGLSTMLATGLLTAVVASASAQEFATRLSGYQETPLTINSNGSGGFTAKVVPRSDTVKCSTDPSTTLLLLSAEPRTRVDKNDRPGRPFGMRRATSLLQNGARESCLSVGVG